MNDQLLTAYRFVSMVVSPWVDRNDILELLENKEALNWESVAYIAGIHSIVQAMWPALWIKNLTHEIPDDFLSYVKNVNELNCVRNRKLKSQLIEIVSIINKLGINPVLIKGAGQLFLKTFANSGDRLLNDLDLLVPRHRIDEIRTEMTKLGYDFTANESEFYVNHLHCAPAEKIGEVATVELHRDLLRKNFQPIFPTKSAWDKSIDIELAEGVEAKILPPTYRVLHCILHSCMVDSNHLLGLVEIRQLHELARTQLIYGDQIDWDRLSIIARKNDIGGILSANLKEAEYFLKFPDLENSSHTNLIAANLHKFRVCAKMKYTWFDYFDTKIAERIVHHFNGQISAPQ